MLNQMEIIQKIKQTLDRAQRVLVIGHQQPDGDALGALIALAYYLKSQNKEYSLFCLDEPVQQYQFLPLIYEVKFDAAIFQKKFDVIVVVDSGDLAYAGVDKHLPPDKDYILINIDHHASNSLFGDLNLVLPDKSSTSEIVYQLFRLWRAPINKEMATALLNGIIFDTGSFSNAATSWPALDSASHLLNLGARHRLINENILRNKSLGLLKLWGRAFERLQYDQEKEMAVTAITLEDFADCGVELEAGMGLSNFFNELSGVKATLVLMQLPNNQIKGSLRTTRDDVDVLAIAKQFGGGGHAKAAGFTIAGKLVYNEGRWQIID